MVPARRRAAPRDTPNDGPCYPKPRHTAAIVQLESVHEEGLPAVVHLLRLNGVEPTIYLNERIRERRPGLKHRFPELKERTRFVPMEGRRAWRRLRQRVRAQDPAAVVMNTFQNQGPVQWASQWECPILGIVHNTALLAKSDLAKQLIAAGRAGVLTLAPHVTADLMASDPALYANTATISYTFPRPPKERLVRSHRRTIVVPGSVNFASRDYRQIIEALPGVAARVDPVGYRITVVGGGKDRHALEQRVAEAGLADQFHFVRLNDEGFVPGAAYYGHLMGADFTLPLMPAESPAFRTQKISSAIPASVGLGIPAIIDRWTATVYDLPAVAYPGPEIAQGLTRALEMSDEQLRSLRAELASYKERELARAAEEMAWALASVGLRP